MPDDGSGAEQRGGKRTVGKGQTWIEVRVSVDDKRRLAEWSERAGLSASFIMRRLLEKALREGSGERGEIP